MGHTQFCVLWPWPWCSEVEHLGLNGLGPDASCSSFLSLARVTCLLVPVLRVSRQSMKYAEPSGFYSHFPIFRKVYQVVSMLQASRCRAPFCDVVWTGRPKAKRNSHESSTKESFLRKREWRNERRDKHLVNSVENEKEFDFNFGRDPPKCWTLHGCCAALYCRLRHGAVLRPGLLCISWRAPDSNSFSLFTYLPFIPT